MLVLAQFDILDPLQEAVTNLFTSLANFLPKAIAFLLILLIGRWVARWIQRLVTMGLRKINFDAVMDRAGLGGPLANAGFGDAGRFIALIIYYTLMLMVLQLALSVFGENAIQDALSSVVAFIPKVIVAIAIIILTGVVANAVRSMLAPAFANMSAGAFLEKIVVGAIWVFGVFAALDQVEVANEIIDTLWTALVGSLGLILVIKFGVGGVWAARDRFWPAVYDKVTGVTESGPSTSARAAEEADPNA